MIVVSRFTVAENDGEAFLVRARDALEALRPTTGYRRGWVGRAADDPTEWILGTEWAGVGAYRRALSGFDVRVRVATLLAEARDEPSAFEILDAGGENPPDGEQSGRA
jgi:heme oxygenase (mycobilin-producing)